METKQLALPSQDRNERCAGRVSSLLTSTAWMQLKTRDDGRWNCPSSETAHNELSYIRDLREKREAEKEEIPWFLIAPVGILIGRSETFTLRMQS